MKFSEYIGPQSLYCSAAYRYAVPGWFIHQVKDVLIAAGVVYYIPVTFPRDVTVDRLGIEVEVAGDAGALARLGIYDFKPNGAPGDLIVDGGTVAVDAVAEVEVSISQHLDKGIYFFALVSDGGPQLEGPDPSYAVSTPVDGFGIALGNVSWNGPVITVMGESGQVAAGLTDPAVTPNGHDSADKALVRARY